jgi:hypothetical protein
MTKQLLIFASGAVLSVAALFAQTSSMGSAFQQPGWIGATGYPTFGPDAQDGPVSGKPFWGTEVRHSLQTLADGTHVDNSNKSTFYRDAQGRMRSESPTQAVIYDSVAGLTYYLDLRNKSYQKAPIDNPATTVSIAVIGNQTSVRSLNFTSSDGTAAGRPRGEIATQKAQHKAFVSSIHSHAITEDLPPQMVNGIYCRGSRITETIPAGTFGNDRDVKITSERWYSDDLQVLVKSSNSDPRFGVTTYDLTEIVQAPPETILFQVPAGYSLRSEGHIMGGGYPNQSKQ